MGGTGSGGEGERAADTPAHGDRTAMLVIDMLNDYAHEDGEVLAANAREVVGPIAALAERARDEGALVIHVNDNLGLWSADRPALIEHAYECGDRSLIDPVIPGPDAPFLFKARHSVFYGTSLGYLLERERIGRLVLTGQVTEQCILYSALDAYLRHYEVVIPDDCVAHIDAELADAAFRLMRRNMRAQILPAGDIEF